MVWVNKTFQVPNVWKLHGTSLFVLDTWKGSFSKKYNLDNFWYYGFPKQAYFIIKIDVG